MNTNIFNESDYMNIVDSPMGSGKTTTIKKALNYLYENGINEKFLFVTPYLDEIHGLEDNKGNLLKNGIIQDCPLLEFTEPYQMGKGKLHSLKELIGSGKNVATTHALLGLFDTQLINMIKLQGYHLILDEVADVVKEYKQLSYSDLAMLISANIVTVDDSTGKVNWVYELDIDDIAAKAPRLDADKSIKYKLKRYDKTRYEDIRLLCNSESLYVVNNKLVVWTMPASIFKAFKTVSVLTYMFDAQIQKYYYDIYGLNYKYFHIKNEDFIETKDKDLDYNNAFKEAIRPLITIIEDDKLNSCGSLTKTWYYSASSKSNEDILKLKKCTYNFFRNKVSGGSPKAMWTTFKTYKDALKGSGFSNGFVSCNARATNQYANCSNCAYLINKFVHPFVTKFFIDHNQEIDQSAYALSEMLQWIWRSQIRCGKPITVYIPSERMRTLLKEFLQI